MDLFLVGPGLGHRPTRECIRVLGSGKAPSRLCLLVRGCAAPRQRRQELPASPATGGSASRLHIRRLWQVGDAENTALSGVGVWKCEAGR